MEPYHFGRGDFRDDGLRFAAAADIVDPAAFSQSHSFHPIADLARRKRRSGVGEHNATLLDLKTAAEAAGLQAQGAKADLAYLRHLDRPALSWVSRSHYVGLMGTAPIPYWMLQDQGSTRQLLDSAQVTRASYINDAYETLPPQQESPPIR